MTTLLKHLFRFILSIAMLVVVFKFLWPTPLEYLEWKWGAETRLTPRKPFEEVMQIRLSEAVGRNLERQMTGAESRLSNGDKSVLEIWSKTHKEYQEDQQIIYGRGEPQPYNPAQFESRLPTPAASVTELGNNAYRIVVPGNQEFHTGIKAPAGWFVEFTQHSGQVKLHPGDTYTNPPEGGFETDKVRDTNDPNARLVWVLQPGRTGALLARFSDSPEYHDVGGHKGTRVQAPADGELLLSVNYLVDGRNFVSGGFQVTVRVTKD